MGSEIKHEAALAGITGDERLPLKGEKIHDQSSPRKRRWTFTFVLRALGMTLVACAIFWKFALSLLIAIPEIASSQSDELLSDKDLIDLIDSEKQTKWQSLILLVRFDALTKGVERDWFRSADEVIDHSDLNPRLLLTENPAHQLMVRVAGGQMEYFSEDEGATPVPESKNFLNALEERSAVVSALVGCEQYAEAYDSWEETSALFEVFTDRDYAHTIWAITSYLEASTPSIYALVESGELLPEQRGAVSRYLSSTEKLLKERVENNIGTNYVRSRTKLLDRFTALAENSGSDWGGLHPIVLVKGSLKVNRTMNRLQKRYRWLHSAFTEPYSRQMSAGFEGDRFLDDFDTGARRYLLGNFAGDTIEQFSYSYIRLDQDYRLGVQVGWLRLLGCALAIQDFEFEERSLPKKIDEICPHYLEVVPVSPFGAGEISYHRDTRRLVLGGADSSDELRVRF